VVAEVFSCTVNDALLVTLLHEPFTVTETLCAPVLSEPVGTLMLDVSPPKAEPSTVHA
jgi:hypothetical protein